MSETCDWIQWRSNWQVPLNVAIKMAFPVKVSCLLQNMVETGLQPPFQRMLSATSIRPPPSVPFLFGASGIWQPSRIAQAGLAQEPHSQAGLARAGLTFQHPPFEHGRPPLTKGKMSNTSCTHFILDTWTSAIYKTCTFSDAARKSFWQKINIPFD